LAEEEIRFVTVVLEPRPAVMPREQGAETLEKATPVVGSQAAKQFGAGEIVPFGFLALVGPDLRQKREGRIRLARQVVPHGVGDVLVLCHVLILG
jgi:hypothetical protein